MTVTTHTIEAALAERFAAPEYAFLLQVRNGTGFQRMVRTADALAFGLYPSRGLTVKGFEIKVSKGDWKRELQNPEKAEDIARFCHTWDIVAPKDVVPVDELPLNWGLIELSDTGKLRAVKAAVTRDPEPLSPLMIASIMRNISNGMIPRSSIQKQIDDAVARAREQIDREIDRRTRGHVRLQEAVRQFEHASGVFIEMYPGDAGRIGDAVRTVLNHHADPAHYLSELKRIRSSMQYLGSAVETAIDQLDAVPQNERRPV